MSSSSTPENTEITRIDVKADRDPSAPCVTLVFPEIGFVHFLVPSEHIVFRSDKEFSIVRSGNLLRVASLAPFFSETLIRGLPWPMPDALESDDLDERMERVYLGFLAHALFVISDGPERLREKSFAQVLAAAVVAEQCGLRCAHTLKERAAQLRLTVPSNAAYFDKCAAENAEHCERMRAMEE